MTLHCAVLFPHQWFQAIVHRIWPLKHFPQGVRITFPGWWCPSTSVLLRWEKHLRVCLWSQNLVCLAKNKKKKSDKSNNTWNNRERNYGSTFGVEIKKCMITKFSSNHPLHFMSMCSFLKRLQALTWIQRSLCKINLTDSPGSLTSKPGYPE